MTEWILSSSILILVVIVLRTMFKGKISPRLQYAIWGLVLLRLLIPFSFGSTHFSVANLTNKTEAPVISVQAEKPIEDVQAEHPVQQPQAQPAETPSQVITPSKPAVSEKKINLGDYTFYILWSAGFAAVAGLFLTTNIRFKRKIKVSREALDVRKDKLLIYASDEIDTPCLFGLWNPAIYVPYAVVEEPTLLRHSLEHEATHYRHGDHIWAVLRCACLAIHWYNPLVWWAAFLSQRDAELACDEATIKLLGEGERAEYGRTLIGMTCRKKTNVLITATTMTTGKGGLKERIMLIAKKPKMALYTLLIVLLAAAVAVGCTFTGAKAEKPETETEDRCARGEILDKNGEILVGKDLAGSSTPTTESPATEMPDNAPPEATIGLGDVGTLYEELDENKICIAVQPTGLVSEGGEYLYIIPANQAALLTYYSEANQKAREYTQWDSGNPRTGWWIVYQDQWWQVTESGAMFSTDPVNFNGICISAEDAKALYELCDMEVKATGIGEPVRPEELTAIKSATLDWNGVHTITDEYALNKLETWFSGSRESGSVPCWFTARLTLELENGEIKVITIATDDCAYYMTEGVAYGFGQVTDVGIEGNEEFYALFATEIIHEQAQEGQAALEEYWVYMHWGLYANKYGAEDTMELMYMFEDYVLSEPSEWKICQAIRSAATADGAYGEYMSYLLAEAYEAAPDEFSFACRQMLPEEDVNRAVNMLAYYWNISPGEARSKLGL